MEWPKIHAVQSAMFPNDWYLRNGNPPEPVPYEMQAKLARLFAAAPEMYAMLERITRHGRPEWGECPSDKAVGVQCQGCEWSRLKATIDGEK